MIYLLQDNIKKFKNKMVRINCIDKIDRMIELSLKNRNV